MKSPEPVVGEPQGGVLDVEHQAAGDVADREQYALVAGAVPEARDDLEIPVADQRRDHIAVHGLRVRQKPATAARRRPLMRRQLQEFFRRCPVVERVDHVRPGRLVEGCDELRELLRVLAAQIHALGEILGVGVQCPILEVDRLAALLQRDRDPAVAVIGPVGP